MNYVKLLGHFCIVHAYTDTTTEIVEKENWKQGDGFYSATFLTCDGVWIEVRVKDCYFEYWYSHYVEGLETVKIEGHLGVEVGRGTGIVKHYIAVGF